MTTKENWQKIKELFHSALELSPEERTVYLDAAGAGNKSLRQEIESLLKLHEKTGDFIDAPAYQVVADMLASAEEFKPGETLAHYEIRSVLGEGGMGTVYLAGDMKLKRNVALKVLPLSNARSGEARERLLREARAAAALDHPNICAIYELLVTGWENARLSDQTATILMSPQCRAMGEKSPRWVMDAGIQLHLEDYNPLKGR